MGEEPEIYVFDFSDAPGAVAHREQIERARSDVRRRYRDHVAAVFDLHGSPDPGALADVALDALIDWRYVECGERCLCSCYPRLPESDFHDYGFGCVCAQAVKDRRRAFREWRNSIRAFWRSPEGDRIRAAERAVEAELEDWLAAQPGITVDSHGGIAPEQWCGEVDGHTFYFRERHGEWRIELDLRPTGRIARVLVGSGPDGEAHYADRELDEGDVIAHGANDVDGYGATPVEGAQFIVDTIRRHLAREACTLHAMDLSSIEALLGREVRWCPCCGSHLPAD